ncbi:MAG TPA: hypothetical protein EYP29_03785 [Thermoplasmata archaeon]|nr:hypothetical protein [Thermoplasmata archaeon]
MTDPEEKDEIKENTEEREMSMSDYEDFWLNRNKVESLEDPTEVEEESMGSESEGFRFEETYTLKGEIIKVLIAQEFARFEYSNGTTAEIPLDELKFCPSCVKEGKYPFSSDGGACPLHKMEYINFDIKRYEDFKVLSQLNGYRG